MDEIDPKYLDIENNKKSILQRIPIFKREDKIHTEEQNYNVGDHVRHTEFGEGVVVTVDKSIVTIAFPHPYGIKKLMKNHKSITKV